MNSKADFYFEPEKKWHKELQLLRHLLLECQLTEVVKWRMPCYTFKENNIALLGAFKDYCAVSFFKGVLLQDSETILEAPGENSQTVLMWKCTSTQEVVALQETLKKYVFEAIEIEKSGIMVPLPAKETLVFPEELVQFFETHPEFKKAFHALTPGRQRGYNLYFSAAKQPQTRTARIEKYKTRILSGKGIHDCVCGLSKKMPTCDGSHKMSSV